MEAKGPPAVEWPIGRRIRYFGGIGLSCAAIAGAITLLMSDIRGERSPNQFSEIGWTALWPAVRLVVLGTALSGVAVGALLPLYRYRYGGVAIGLVVYSLLLLAGVVSGGSFTMPADPVARGQLIVMFVGFGAVAALTGSQARAWALGERDDTSSDVPPVI